MSKIRVLLVDDELAVRRGLRMLLRAEPDLEVVGEAVNGRLAQELVAQCKPDVVLMDVRMPVVDGIEATASIHAHHPTVKVLVLTMFDDASIRDSATKAGASTVLAKDQASEALVPAIYELMGGIAR